MEDSYDDRPLTLQLWFHAGQRKEGCMSLALFSYEGSLYTKSRHGKNKTDGKNVIYIGAVRDRRTVMS